MKESRKRDRQIDRGRERETRRGSLFVLTCFNWSDATVYIGVTRSRGVGYVHAQLGCLGNQTHALECS